MPEGVPDRLAPLRAARDFLLQGALIAGLLLAVVPFHDWLVNSWTRFSPASDFAALVLGGGFLLWLLRPGKDRTHPPFALPLVCFWAVSLLSALVNRVPFHTAMEGLREALPWTVTALLAERVCRPRDVPRFLWVMAAAAGLLSLYGVVSYVAYWRAGGPYGMGPAWPSSPVEQFLLYPYFTAAFAGSWRLPATFLNENYFGVWLSLLAPVVFTLFLTTPRRPARYLALAAATLMMAALAWTYSRTALLALGVAFAFYAWRGTPRILFLLLPLALAVPCFLQRSDVRRFTNVGATEGGRLASMRRSTEVLARNPLLGAGPGTRGMADSNYAKIAYETGLLGLGCWAWLIGTALAPALRRRPGANRLVLVSGSAAVAAVAAAGISSDVWEAPQVALYAWTLAGLVHAAKAPSPAVDSAEPLTDNTVVRPSV